MNCPVCQASNLPDDLKKCPQCDSDLEVFQVTRRIDKAINNRMLYGVLASILAVALLLAWLISAGMGDEKKQAGTEDADTEQVQLKTELEKVRAEKNDLQSEVVMLKEKLAEKEKEPEKRIKEYIVQNGESLFGIARKVYGNGFRYVDLAKDNNITDPGHILTGQTLIIYY